MRWCATTCAFCSGVWGISVSSLQPSKRRSRCLSREGRMPRSWIRSRRIQDRGIRPSLLKQRERLFEGWSDETLIPHTPEQNAHVVAHQRICAEHQHFGLALGDFHSHLLALAPFEVSTLRAATLSTYKPGPSTQERPQFGIEVTP